MATSFPTSLDTANTLYDAVNNASSTVSISYTAGGSTLDLTSAALFPSTGGVIYVGNERTVYTGKTSNQLTGVTPLSNNYPAGTTAAMYVDADHHNVLRGAIVAVETIVGATGSVVAGTVTKRLTDLEAASSSTSSQIHAAAAKSSPEDADEFGITDNAGSWALKKTTWSQIKSTLSSTALSWTAIQTFTNSMIKILGSSTGKTTLTSANASATDYTLTLPAATDTLVGKATTDTLTNKTLTSPTLTTPALGTPSSGNLSSCTADGTNAPGFLHIPQLAETTSHTFALSDAGKHIYITGTATLTIPTNASVAYPLGTTLTFINNASAVTTFTTTSLTVYKAGTSAAWASGGTLSIRGMCTWVKVATDTWFVNGTTLS